MAYTTPRTWTDGELVTAAIMNPHVRDNFSSMGPHLIARKTADQTQGSGVFGDDSHLVLAMGASEVWHVRVFLNVTVASIALSWKFPAGSLAITAHVATAHQNWTDTSSPAGNFVVTQGMLVVDGFVIAGSAGNFLPYYAGSGGSTTVKQHSTLWAVKLA